MEQGWLNGVRAVTAYRIKDWSRSFMASDMKRSAPGRPLPWVAVPTKHDGKGFRRLWKLPNAANVFSGFMLMVELAAKAPVWGLLADHDGPMDADAMADKTGASAHIFTEALKALIGGNIGWIEVVELEGIPEYQKILSKSAPTGRDGTGRNETKRFPADAGDSGRVCRDRQPPLPDHDGIGAERVCGSGTGRACEKQPPSPAPKQPPSPTEPSQPPSPNAKSRKEPTGPHADLIRHFLAQWEARWKADYIFQKKDGVAASKVLKAAAGDLGRACKIVDAYIACGDQFLSDQKHPFTMLINQINRFRVESARAPSRNGFVGVSHS